MANMLKNLMENEDPFIEHCQYNGCWCPEDSQDNSSHDTKLILIQYPTLFFSTVQV